MNYKIGYSSLLSIVAVIIMLVLPMKVNANESINQDSIWKQSDFSNMQKSLNILEQDDMLNRTTFAFTKASIAYKNSQDGIYVAITTVTNMVANEIGFKEFELQEKTLLGWRTTAKSGSTIGNASHYVADATFEATKGKTYRMKYTYIATRNGVRIERPHTTNEFVHTY